MRFYVLCKTSYIKHVDGCVIHLGSALGTNKWLFFILFQYIYIFFFTSQAAGVTTDAIVYAKVKLAYIEKAEESGRSILGP